MSKLSFLGQRQRTHCNWCCRCSWVRRVFPLRTRTCWSRRHEQAQHQEQLLQRRVMAYKQLKIKFLNIIDPKGLSMTIFTSLFLRFAPFPWKPVRWSHSHETATAFSSIFGCEEKKDKKDIESSWSFFVISQPRKAEKKLLSIIPMCYLYEGDFAIESFYVWDGNIQVPTRNTPWHVTKIVKIPE